MNRSGVLNLTTGTLVSVNNEVSTCMTYTSDSLNLFSGSWLDVQTGHPHRYGSHSKHT